MRVALLLFSLACGVLTGVLGVMWDLSAPRVLALWMVGGLSMSCWLLAWLVAWR